MNNKTVTITVIAIVFIIAGAIIYSKTAGFAVENPVSEDAAKWIGEHSVLYVQTTCIHCKEQEALFGENVKYLTMVDESNPQSFIDAGVEATPTWIINNQKYVGVQTVEKLKELTGYKELS
jgi:hypothetical protein